MGQLLLAPVSANQPVKERKALLTQNTYNNWLLVFFFFKVLSNFCSGLLSMGKEGPQYPVVSSTKLAKLSKRETRKQN